MERSDVLIKVNNLVKHFPITQRFIFEKMIGAVRAVDGVSFSIWRGETLGLVGESGCGKSTTGRLILRLIEATQGQVFFDGRNIFELDERRLREVRREMQIIFQDPYGSLNPRMTVGDIIGEPLYIHGVARGIHKKKRIHELLDIVGLASYHAKRYPHEFSGGQRQRIAVAAALALNPKFIICDEPVSALDVSIQAQIINLLQDLQKLFRLTYLFISHDLSVIRHISDRVVVMYMGKIVELADNQELFKNSQHPYTKALMSAIPCPNPKIRKNRIVLKGDVPNPANPPSGCRFHTRCPLVEYICSVDEPAFLNIGDDHYCACHIVQRNTKK